MSYLQSVSPDLTRMEIIYGKFSLFIWLFDSLLKSGDPWVQIQYDCTMEEDRAANQRSAFLLSFTLALYISNGFGLSKSWTRKIFIVTVCGSLLKVSFLVIYWLIQAGQHRNFSSLLGVWSTPHTFLCSHAQSPSWQVELKNSQGQVTELVDVFSPCKTDSSVYCYGKVFLQ